ncbi:adenylate/guanylate cyclase domain-containing protein [Rhodovibrio sodomensis]|uniref:adenylate/guanylate cyclase domain-containing protein n=1 Tax=Rhodovibrio sodomensis TaxID=1088 RepID=UPI001904B958
MDVRAWLQGIGLEVYADTFEEQAIDRALLPDLTAQDLKDLGVGALGHRKRLLAAIAQLGAEPGVVAGGLDNAEPSRRQVTVVFVDLCGYTLLANQIDPEDLHALLNRYFDIVDSTMAEFGGRTDKHVGDAVMAVFGAPVAHSNDPERAVRAAWEVRKRLATLGLAAAGSSALEMHAGIAAGEVLASSTGSRHHLEYTVTGESVNLAARLQELAGPGDILLSDDVYRAVSASVAAQQETRAIRGFDAPAPFWRLADVHTDQPTSVRYGFVGRTSELCQVDHLLKAAANGEGGCVVVRGEAGIGKTRFAAECGQRAEAAGFRVHLCQVLDFGAEIGRDVVRTLVRKLIDLDPGADAPAQRAGAATRLALELDLAPPQIAALNDLLNLPQHGRAKASYAALAPDLRHETRHELVARIVHSRSASQPLMLIVEDVHWANALALRQFARLAAIAGQGAMLLMLTTRAEGDPLGPAWAAETGDVSVATAELAPLAAHDAGQLAAEISQGDAAVMAGSLARAGGNPLFLEQLVLSAQTHGARDLPGSLQSLIQARLDALDPPDRHAARAASVLGQSFNLATLRDMLDAPSYACDGLADAYLVRREASGYRFAHALIRDGVYASVPKRERTALHLRAAAWFEDRDAPLWARHLGLGNAPTAALAYLTAARQEAGQYRFDAALSLVEQGLAIARTASERSSLALECGDLLTHLGRVDGALASYDAAVDVAPCDAARALALVGRVRGMRIAEQIDGALALLDDAQATAEREDMLETLAEIHHLRGNLYFPLGRNLQCEAEHRHALELARRIGSRAWEAKALGGLGDAAYALGQMQTAHDSFVGCVALCRQLGLGATEVANASMIAHAQLYLLELPAAAESCVHAIAFATQVGHWRAELNANASAMWVAREIGDFDKARACNERARYLVENHGASRYLAEVLCMDAELQMAAGNRGACVDLLRHALALQRESGIAFFGPINLGLLALHTEDTAERAAALSEAEGLLARGSLGHNVLQFYRDAILGAVRQGALPEVERYARALEGYTRAEPLAWSSFFCRWGRAMAFAETGDSAVTSREQLRALRAEAMALGLHAYESQLATKLDDLAA